MRIFLYEFITAGGMFSLDPDKAPTGSLLREGAAMFEILAADLAAIPNVEVAALRDGRLDFPNRDGIAFHIVQGEEEESQQFDAIATDADWTIVIAPEFNDSLLNRVQRVESIGCRLLSPNSEVVAIGTDKTRTIELLSEQNIRTPRGIQLDTSCSVPKKFPFPAVLKPVDGAGSQGLLRIDRRESLADIDDGVYRLEVLQRGLPVSVAVLSGPESNIVMPACSQKFSDDGSFQYLGGRVPLDSALCERAQRLAMRAVRMLPTFVGYVGFDIILGETPGSDVIVELNPRLTTSYIGLRQLTHNNLAQAMLDVAEGKAPDLSFDVGPIEFQADGSVIHLRQNCE